MKKLFFLLKKRKKTIMAARRLYLCDVCQGLGYTAKQEVLIDCTACNGDGECHDYLCKGNVCNVCHGNKKVKRILKTICSNCKGNGTVWR